MPKKSWMLKEVLECTAGLPPLKNWARTGTPWDHGQCHNMKTTKLDLQPRHHRILSRSGLAEWSQGIFFPSPHGGLGFRMWFLGCAAAFPALKSELLLDRDRRQRRPGRGRVSLLVPGILRASKRLDFGLLKLRTVSSLWCFVSSEESLGLFPPHLSSSSRCCHRF